MLKLSDRFFRALCLCAGDGNVKTRLAEAWINYLDEVPAARLPESAQPEFERIHAAMHSVDAMPEEHAARAAVRKMSAQEATEHTRGIAAIFRELIASEAANTVQPELTPKLESAEISFDPEHDKQLN